MDVTLAIAAAAIGASIWLGEFAYKHVNYSNELWWQFELHGEASRFLRGTVGAVVLLLLFAFARLIGHAPHETSEPTDADHQPAEPVEFRPGGRSQRSGCESLLCFRWSWHSWAVHGCTIAELEAVPSIHIHKPLRELGARGL